MKTGGANSREREAVYALTITIHKATGLPLDRVLDLSESDFASLLSLSVESG